MIYDDRAENIIKVQGLSFALAAMNGNNADIREARLYLKKAIVEALLEAAIKKGEPT